MGLNRRHASRLASSRALKAARGLFRDSFSHEPMCSDEVVPLLALAVPDAWLSDEPENPAIRLYDLPLYQSTGTMKSYEHALTESLKLHQGCVTYAFWPG